MTSPKPPHSKKRFLFIAAGAVVVLGAVFVLLLGFLLRNDEGGRKKPMQMVTLLAPPPPPKIEEKPPEPEKKEEKIEEPPQEKPAEKPEPAKEPPPAQNLGLDANAGLGGDAFGLEARRGGSNLIGGGGAGSPYAWYAGQIGNNLQKTANEIIQREGGIPPGKWEKVSLEVTMDMFGKIAKFSILNSSGSQKIDEAVKKALQTAQSFEPPPPGMPKVLRFAVSLQG